MAAAGQLTKAPASGGGVSAVTWLRAGLIVGTLVIWELLSRSGWLYRDVVPSLFAIAKALVALLSGGDYYFHLGVTLGEIALALVIGGGGGVIVGLLLGANRFLARAFEIYLYYLGPTPKIIFFPVMIMWFGVGSGSKVALGALSCFFPVALSVAAGMRQIDRVLIRVGRSFRADTRQMITKIYLPAMRHPIINGVRLGLGIAEAMKGRIIHRPALKGGVELVAGGEAEIGFYPKSEVISAAGLALVGPLPAGIQLTTIYGAAVTAASAVADAGTGFVAFMRDPAHRAVWAQGGFDAP